MITHLTRDEGEVKLHISHLHQYVSAYMNCPEQVEQLSADLQSALDIARLDRKSQIVDHDGEMFFVVYPSGTISLCLRWKTYQVAP